MALTDAPGAPRAGSGAPRASDAALQGMLNPLRSEGEAFRFLLYAIAVIAVVVVLVLVARAIL